MRTTWVSGKCLLLIFLFCKMYINFFELQKIDCLHNNAVMELMRGLRSQLTELISGLGVQDLAPMSLGLSHSLSRYKLKFSPDKVNSFYLCLSVSLPYLLSPNKYVCSPYFSIQLKSIS